MVSTEGMGSDWLKADDITDGDTAVIIDEAVEGTVGEDKQLQCTLDFKGKHKRFGFNKTNLAIMQDFAGFESKDWMGKTIILYKNPTKYMGKPVIGVRIGMPPQAGKAPGGPVEASKVEVDPPNPDEETPAQRCARGEHLPTTLAGGKKVCGHCAVVL